MLEDVARATALSESRLQGVVPTPEPAPKLPGMTLPACPATPNCVSSQADDETHFVAPIEAGDDGLDRLAALIERTPRASVHSRTATSLHAVFISAVFRFRDDLHAEVGSYEGRPVLHVRSGSRLGVSDLGVNRRRVEWIRDELTS